jgi:arylsulfatase A-like enzyme
LNEPLDRRDVLKLMSLLPAMGWSMRPEARPEGSGREEAANQPNILIIVFDALSAANMSLHGYRRDTTPNIDRFASQATVFRRHYAGGNFTSPGTASLLTGVYPWSHRALQLHSLVEREYERKNLFSAFGDGTYSRFAFSHNPLVVMLLVQFEAAIEELVRAEALSLLDDRILLTSLFTRDFNTALIGEKSAIRGEGWHPASPFFSILHRMLRISAKNDIREQLAAQFPRGLPSTTNGALVFRLEEAIDWLAGNMPGMRAPFLGYMHFYPPHRPYNTRAEFVDHFQDGWDPPGKPEHVFSEGHNDNFLNKHRRRYDEYIAYADSEFGRLLDSMRAAGMLRDTYVVLTADHGEMFERGIIAHITPTLFEPVIHIPLMILRPGTEEHLEVDQPTSCVDLVPTLLHVTGRAIPDWCEGEILPTFDGPPPDPPRSVYALEAKKNYRERVLKHGTLALMKGEHKLIHYFGYDSFPDTYELFDMANDPQELENLYSPDWAIARQLQEELLAKLEQVNEPYR